MHHKPPSLIRMRLEVVATMPFTVGEMGAESDTETNT